MHSPLLLAAIALLIAISISTEGGALWPSAITCIPVLATAYILLRKADFPIFRWQAVDSTGRLSYSIYLWHWPVLLLFKQNFSEALSPLSVAAALVLTIALATLSYRYIETLRDKQKSFHGLTLHRFQFLTTAAIAGACIVIWTANGIQSRGASPPAVYIATQEAARDWTYPSTCGFKSNSGRLNLCETGHPSSARSVLFIGDSHAEQWFARYDFLAAKDPSQAYVAFATYGGCPPIWGVNRTAPGFECPAYLKTTLAASKSRKWDQIVIQSFWPAYFIHLESGLANPLLCLSDGGGCDGPPIQLERDFHLVEQRLIKTISMLKEHATDVAIVMPTPYIERDLIKDKMRSDFFGTHLLAKDGIHKEEFHLKTGQVRRLLFEVAKQTGANLIDPTDHVCTDGKCLLMDSKDWLFYRDGNHYRAAHVRSNVNFLDEAVLGTKPSHQSAPNP